MPYLTNFAVGAAVLDYAAAPSATLRLDYANLNFNYMAANSLGFDLHMKGRLIAAFKF